MGGKAQLASGTSKPQHVCIFDALWQMTARLTTGTAYVNASNELTTWLAGGVRLPRASDFQGTIFFLFDYFLEYFQTVLVVR